MRKVKVRETRIAQRIGKARIEAHTVEQKAKAETLRIEHRVKTEAENHNWFKDALDDLVELWCEWGWELFAVLPVGFTLFLIETFVTPPPVDWVYALNRTGYRLVVLGQIWTIAVWFGLVAL